MGHDLISSSFRIWWSSPKLNVQYSLSQSSKFHTSLLQPVMFGLTTGLDDSQGCHLCVWSIGTCLLVCPFLGLTTAQKIRENKRGELQVPVKMKRKQRFRENLGDKIGELVELLSSSSSQGVLKGWQKNGLSNRMKQIQKKNKNKNETTPPKQWMPIYGLKNGRIQSS